MNETLTEVKQLKSIYWASKKIISNHFNGFVYPSDFETLRKRIKKYEKVKRAGVKK